MMDRTLHTPKHKKTCEDVVKQYINLRPCKSGYTPDYTKSGDLCVCGRNKAWHSDHGADVVPVYFDGKAIEQSQLHHSNTPVYGNIDFSGYGKKLDNHAPYLKVDEYLCNDYISGIWRVMKEYWRLESPRLIITITGGAKRFDLNPRLKSALKTGLVHCAQSTGAWLVTGGTKTGVRELVGEAVRDHYLTQKSAAEQGIVALAVVTWNVIAGKECLIPSDGKGLYPARYAERDVSEAIAQSANKVFMLDPNHTHYLFVDKSQSERMYLSNSEFNALLFDSIKMPRADSSGKDVSVPKVKVIINGGLGTITEVFKNATKAQLPLILIRGSGRATDYIGIALDMVPQDEMEENQYPDNFDQKMTVLAKQMFEWDAVPDEEKQKKLINQCLEELRVILSNRKLVTEFKLDNEYVKDLDTAIFHSIFKANASNLHTLLHLVLGWNKPDIARKLLFSLNNKQHWKKQEYRDLLDKAMFTALCDDQVDFVELFLDNGVEWSQFLTPKVLRDLYYETLIKRNGKNPTSCLVYEILQSKIIGNQGSYPCCRDSNHMLSTSQKLLFYVGHLVSMLADDIFENIYEGDRYIIYEDSSSNYDNKNTEPNGKKETEKSYPIRDLFLWAILQNKKEMALMFWKEVDHCIGTALIGSAILKALSEYSADSVEMELSQSLSEHALYFETHAIGVLSECYTADRGMTHRHLVTRSHMWGNSTNFSVASGKELMNFMEQSACQTKLSKIWYGRLAQYTSVGQVISSMIFPPMIFSIKFVESADKPDDMKMVRSVAAIGTNLIGGEADNQVSPDDKSKQYQVDAEEDEDEKIVYSVYCCGGCGDDNSVAFLMAFFYFIRSPLVKFGYHTFTNIIYLLLFSYVLIVEIRPRDENNWVSIPEYVVWFWAFTMWLEEVRQIMTEENRSIKHKIPAYFKSLWNVLDFFCFGFLILSIIFRFAFDGAAFDWARLVYCIALSLYYVRFLQVFFVDKNLGPKVLMIYRMLRDLFFFIMIMALFLLAYGTVSHAMRNPNPEIDWAILKNVLYEPYWNIYGELFLENIEEDMPGCSSNETELDLNADLRRCTSTSSRIFMFIALALYMLMINILLLNLLIAMFSDTFQQVQANAEQMWRFYRYNLIYEYYDRPTLPPPFIFVNHLHRVAMYMWRKCRGCPEANTEFSIDLPEHESSKLHALEYIAMQRYIHSLYTKEQKHVETKISNTEDKIDKISTQLDCLKRQTKDGRNLQRHSSTLQRQESSMSSNMPYYPGPSYKERDNDIMGIKQTLNTLSSQMASVTSMLENLQQQQQTQAQEFQKQRSYDGVGSQDSIMQSTRQRPPPPQMRVSDLNTWVTQCPDLPENDGGVRNVSDDET